LFGGASLVRYWGRIGTNGQAKINTYDDPHRAKAAYWQLERVKRRRGYKEPEASKNSASHDVAIFAGKRAHIPTLLPSLQAENVDD
ncbi:hypothetical protein Rleg4DRAFT_7611, partial [Rhizobium leguminosarum bv. trifolii WSM2297]